MKEEKVLADPTYTALPGGDSGVVPPGESVAFPKTILIKAGSSDSENFGVADKMRSDASGYREQEKQRQAVLRRLRREEALILSEMEKLESEKTRLEIELGRPDVYSSAEKARQTKHNLDEIIAALEIKSHQWESNAREIAFAEK